MTALPRWFSQFRPRSSRFLWLVFAVGYYLACLLGRAFAFPPETISTLWPANGLLLAVLLFQESRVWPRILVVALLAGAAADWTIDVGRVGDPVFWGGSLLLSLANFGEATLGAWWLRRWVDRPLEIHRLRVILGFAIWVAGFASAIGAVAGAAAASGFHGADFFPSWRMRWFGDAFGHLVSVPLILAWAIPRKSLFPLDTLRRRVELGALAVMSVAATQLVFDVAPGAVRSLLDYPYFIFPLFLWAGLRFDFRIVTTFCSFIGLVSVCQARAVSGPVATPGEFAAEGMLTIQIFLAVLILSTLILSATLRERWWARQQVLEQLQFGTLFSQMSTNFINLPAANLDAEIGHSLGVLGEFLGVDRGEVLQFNQDFTRLRCTHEWFAQGFDGESSDQNDLLTEDLSWIVNAVRRGKEVMISRVEDVPEERERGALERRRTRSSVCLPLIADGEVLGYVSFDATRQEKEWSPVQVGQLKLVGELFASALVRRRNQEALRRSEARYRSIVEDQTELIMRWRPDGTRTFVNDAYCRYCGISREECLGSSFFPLLEPRDRERIHHKLSSLTVDQPVATDEHHQTLEDGSVRWQQWTDRGIFDPSGRLVELQSVGRDVSERRNAEAEAERHRQELTHAEKMVTLGTLVSGVAHEINNPNHFILLNAPLLREVWRDAEPVLEAHGRHDSDFLLANLPYEEMRSEVPEIIDEIKRGAERIKLIVSELRAYTRGQTSLGPVDLDSVVRSALTLLAIPIKKATRHFSVEYNGSLPTINGNLRRLEQVVINLLLNACQALEDPEGAVRVQTGTDEATKEVWLRVEDEGCGISQGDLSRVFDPFFTTKRESGGTGLGLAIAARIVDEHRGTLRYRSEVGRGTTARLALPIAEPRDFPEEEM